MKPLTEDQIALVNPGIRYTVQKLREWGFNTCDSGDGETHDFACDQPFPYVHIQVSSKSEFCMECDRLLFMLKCAGIDFDERPHPQDDPEGWADYPSIQASYSPVDGGAFIHLANVIIPEQ